MGRILIVSLAVGAAVALCAATFGNVTASTDKVTASKVVGIQVAQKGGQKGQCPPKTRWNQREGRCVPTG